MKKLPPTRHHSMLFVHDNPAEILRLRRILAASPIPSCPMFKAASVEEAFGLLKKKEPDLVLLQVQLEGASGLVLLERFEKELQTQRPHYMPYWILLSDIDDPRAKMFADQNGIQSFLERPFKNAAFIYAVLQGISHVKHAKLDHLKRKIKILQEEGIEGLRHDITKEGRSFERMFLVNDDQEELSAWSDHFNDAECRAWSASQSAAAIALVEAYEPQLVVIKIKGPSSLDVLKAARRINPKSQIIFVLDVTDEALAQETKGAGVFACLKAPVSLDALEKIVEEARKILRHSAS